MPSEHPSVLQAGADAARPAPVALPPRLTRGLHIVALFEAAKGLLVLAGGLGALSLLNRDASLLAEKIVRYLLLNPDSHYTQVFLKHASLITNRQLLMTALVAGLYATTRFVEAYGLWKNRGWAEWMAVAGGMIYFPFEIAALLNKATALRFGLLSINILIVLYVARVLWIKRRARRATGLPAD